MNTEEQSPCCEPACGCGPKYVGWNRRDFLKTIGVGALVLSPLGAMAGPFERDDIIGVVPVDKKLSAAWVRSLFERGSPETFRGRELRYVGMPVGGIACGQLYLGGDGRPWLWDIFKCQYVREKHGGQLSAMSVCGHYTNPPTPETAVTPDDGAHVEQGFALQVSHPDVTDVRFLDARGFAPEHISFRGEYPVGRVEYADPALPVRARLEAFSPFVPLNAPDSAIPATIFAWELTNTSDQPVRVQLAGFLENAVCPYDHDRALGQRRSRTHRDGSLLVVAHEPQPDSPAGEQRLRERHGYGSLALGLLDANSSSIAHPNATTATGYSADEMFRAGVTDVADSPFDARPMGSIATAVALEPGQSAVVRFVIGWYFPDFAQEGGKEMARVTDFARLRRHYAARFGSAGDVVRTIAAQWDELAGTTRAWNRTWYDSTLPYWLLDRTFIGLDCVATQTSHWYSNGRFWGWEGVDCCPGTCTHVWQYAQAMARIFPEIERDLRQRVDFGLALDPKTGVIAYRAENALSPAADGQAGTILRVLREHRMSKDTTFLAAIWPKVKLAFGYLERLDTNGDGLLDADQANTLDAAWAGEIAWISSLYVAAAEACVEMAGAMNDTAFATHCAAIVAKGRQQLVAQLFNGEYFIQKPDPAKPDRINTNKGCHIDQVLGQSFGYQVGLRERVVPKPQTETALRSLWKYNFTPDAGGYALRNRVIGETFRWYAMPGEAGLLMTTWPNGGADKAIPGVGPRTKEDPAVWTGPGGYFNECMNGFEYQAASHMIYEGSPGSDLVQNGLAVTKAVHERYRAAARNPYNEIECSDHYARSMASYGIFLAVCGFDYDGPRGHLGFAPRLTPENFKAAFTAAEGWGSYAQQRTGRVQTATLTLARGTLRLQSLALELPAGAAVARVEAHRGSSPVEATFEQSGSTVITRFAAPLTVTTGEDLRVALTY